MIYLKAKIVKEVIITFGIDFRRIEHALDVLKESDKLLNSYTGYDYEIVLASALLHDIGIKKSEQILGYNNGHTQEKYGPPIAKKILTRIGLDQKKIAKVCEIIGNHHSKSRYDYIELKILKHADQIVNKRGSSHIKKQMG